MTSGPRQRSPAALVASRRNGANSKGPLSAAGKAKSAQNARKHGLFSTVQGERQERSAEGKAFAAMLHQLQQGRCGTVWHGEVALEAARKLEDVAGLVRHLQDELGAVLHSGDPRGEQLDRLVKLLASMRRYQRRFRGQRDRAIRAILKAPVQ